MVSNFGDLAEAPGERAACTEMPRRRGHLSGNVGSRQNQPPSEAHRPRVADAGLDLPRCRLGAPLSAAGGTPLVDSPTPPLRSRATGRLQAVLCSAPPSAPDHGRSRPRVPNLGCRAASVASPSDPEPRRCPAPSPACVVEIFDDVQRQVTPDHLSVDELVPVFDPKAHAAPAGGARSPHLRATVCLPAASCA